MSETKSNAPFHVFTDEFWYYSPFRDEPIKEVLRKIEGIPNASYKNINGEIFVFQKLLLSVISEIEKNPNGDIEKIALDLMPTSIVSAKDAVENWSVSPSFYSIVEVPYLGFIIRHDDFNARLPKIYQSEKDAKDVFVDILLGKIQPGAGEFSYRGQEMILLDPLDPSFLPVVPEISVEPGLVSYAYAYMGGVKYWPDFTPVSQSMWDEVAKLETDWNSLSSNVLQHAKNNAHRLWSNVDLLDLKSLDSEEYTVDDYAKEDAAKLRDFYPELSVLSDGSLYELYDRYSSECGYYRGWTPSREDDFLFFLIGKLADNSQLLTQFFKYGKFVAFSLLRGDSIKKAKSFSNAAMLYDSKLKNLASRMASASRFSTKEKLVIDMQGNEITTMSDFVKACRFTAFKPTISSQEIHKPEFSGFKLSEVPYEKIHEGMEVISNIGTPGKVKELFEKRHHDDDNNILIFWDNNNQSFAYHYKFDKVTVK